MTDTTAIKAEPSREAQADEPVCWIVLAKETDNVRIWWRRKEMAEEWAKTHNAPLIPLYAHPRCADAILRAPAGDGGQRVSPGSAPAVKGF